MQQTRYIFDGNTPKVPIMRLAYVASIVLPSNAPSWYTTSPLIYLLPAIVSSANLIDSFLPRVRTRRGRERKVHLNRVHLNRVHLNCLSRLVCFRFDCHHLSCHSDKTPE